MNLCFTWPHWNPSTQNGELPNIYLSLSTAVALIVYIPKKLQMNSLYWEKNTNGRWQLHKLTSGYPCRHKRDMPSQ